MSDSCDPMDCSLSGSSVHGILQARILELVSISSSRVIFPTQESTLGLLHRRQILYQLSHQESPILRSEDINININQWRKMCPRGPHSKPAKVGSQEVKTQGRGFLLFYSLLCPQKWGGD